MPTENRRVATYLPKELDECLLAFKQDRGLNGDSPALIAILSEFFGVSQKVAHQVEPLVNKQEFEDRLLQLRSELLGELSSELKVIRDNVEAKFLSLESRVGSVQQVKDELLSELKSKLPKEDEVPGQLQLIPDQSQVSSELLSESSNELENPSVDLKPLSGALLSERFGIHAYSVNNKKNLYKSNPEKFIEWTKRKDPDGIAWEPRGKLFHPMIASNQVNPLPEGSERSGEG
jgi:hypothetical protein